MDKKERKKEKKKEEKKRRECNMYIKTVETKAKRT